MSLGSPTETSGYAISTPVSVTVMKGSMPRVTSAMRPSSRTGSPGRGRVPVWRRPPRAGWPARWLTRSRAQPSLLMHGRVEALGDALVAIDRIVESWRCMLGSALLAVLSFAQETLSLAAMRVQDGNASGKEATALSSSLVTQWTASQACVPAGIAVAGALASLIAPGRCAPIRSGDRRSASPSRVRDHAPDAQIASVDPPGAAL